MKRISKTFLWPLLVIAIIFSIFLFFAWFVLSPARASQIDRLILYNTNEVFRYYLIRSSVHNPYIFINSFVRPFYALAASIFYNVLPFNMLSLRIMNIFFSCSALYLTYRLVKILGFEDSFSIVTILIIATSPIYFLHSISSHAAIMFCFFLILATYLFYRKKYLSSVIVCSLLPLIRPEGYLSLFIWSFFLFREREKKNIRYYIPLLFFPLCIWALSNRLILGPQFLSRFCYQSLLASRGVYGKISFDAFPLIRPDFDISPVSFLLSLGYPLLILFLFGLTIKLFDRKYFLLSVCLFLYFLLYSSTALAVNFGFEKVNIYGLMATITSPIMPFIGIFAVVPLLRFKKHKQSKAFIIALYALILIVGNVYQAVKFRQDPRCNYRALHNLEEERVLKEAVAWFKDYAEKNNIKRLYISTDDAVCGFSNIILIYLPPDIKFYMVFNEKNNISAIDLVTFKVLPIDEENSIYLARNNKVPFHYQIESSFIKGFDPISLYFYSLQKVK